MSAGPDFFASAADLRDWPTVHHATAPELLVGFWKKAAGKPSIERTKRLATLIEDSAAGRNVGG